MNARRVVVAAALAMALANPAPAEAARVPDAVTDALAVAGTDRTAAIRTLTMAAADAKGPVLRSLLVHLAEQHRLQGQGDAARQRFTEALDTRGPADLEEVARLGLAVLDAQAQPGSVDDAWVATWSEPAGLDTLDASRALLIATHLSEQGADPRPATREALALSSDDAALHARIEAQVDRLAMPVAGPDDGVVPAPYRDGAPVPEALERAREALSRGDLDAAARQARALLDRPDLTLTEQHEARLLLAAARSQPADPDVVGVLLPLSGRFERVGLQVQDALQHGWARAGEPARLVVVDTGATPESAVGALEGLVAEHDPLAVLGPLLSDQTEPVATAADRLAVPLVTLSQALADASDHDWVFQAWVTPRQQVDSLLDEVMGVRGLDTFAIFAPSSAYGTHAAEVFTTAVTERGGSIAIRTDYDAGTNNHIPWAHEMARKRPPREEDERVPPVVDFQAIFLPDSAAAVPIAAAGLAYEEFPVGRFRPVKDGDGIPLLGLSGWNRETLIAAGGKYTRDGLFTDVFVPPPRTPGLRWYADEAWQEFDASFTAAAGRHPTPIEALADDAAYLVGRALAQAPATRLDFRDALLAVDPEGSVTGATGFDPETHVLQREVAVMVVREDGFDPVEDEAEDEDAE